MVLSNELMVNACISILLRIVGNLSKFLYKQKKSLLIFCFFVETKGLGSFRCMCVIPLNTSAICRFYDKELMLCNITSIFPHRFVNFCTLNLNKSSTFDSLAELKKKRSLM